MSPKSFYEDLKRVPLFANFDDDDFDEMMPIVTEVRVPAGEVLIREGELGHELIVILTGEVDVSRDGVSIGRVAQGGFVGEMALISGEPRNSTVTASSDADLLLLDGRGFSALLERLPRLAVSMLPIVARRAAANVPDHQSAW
jgi:CRP-like cAMP-binding protein